MTTVEISITSGNARITRGINLTKCYLMMSQSWDFRKLIEELEEQSEKTSTQNTKGVDGS